MSNMLDLKGKLAGTSALDIGGEDTVNDLTDFFVTFHKDAADSAAGDATNRSFWRNKLACDVRIVSVEYVPDAALTAHDTTYATLTLNQGTPGSLAAAAAVNTKITGGTGDWVADTAEALTVDPDNATVDPGDILNFDIAKNSTGVVVPAGSLVVQLRRV